jgi:hypothetical protein
MTDPTPAAGVSHKSETPAHRSPQLRNNRLIVRAQPSSQLAEVSLDLYLSDPHSPLALAQARLAAESLISTGALIVRDSRAPREANDRFIDLFEDYFAQDQDALKADERPEVGYQVVSTSTVRKSIVPRLEKIRCSVELSLTEPGSHPRKYGEAKVLFRRGMSRYHRLTRCGGAAARRDGPWRGSEVPVCELLHSSGGPSARRNASVCNQLGVGVISLTPIVRPLQVLSPHVGTSSVHVQISRARGSERHAPGLPGDVGRAGQRVGKVHEAGVSRRGRSEPAAPTRISFGRARM